MPRITVPIDVEVADDVELHNRFDILTRLLSGDECHDDDSNYESSDSSDSLSDVSSSSERSRRRRKPRQDRKPKQSEPPDLRKAQGTTPEMRRRNSESAKRRITRKIDKISALDIAFYLYDYRTYKEDLELLADAKPYLTKDTEYFTNGDGSPERWIARCVFQNASSADSLETFIQLNYRENFYSTHWSRFLAKEGQIQP